MNPGQPLVINCTVIMGNWAESIVWTRRETQTSLTSIAHASPGRWSAIVFGSVTQKDAGTYECRVKKGSRQELCEITLHVNCEFCFDEHSFVFVYIRVLD